MAIPVVSSVVPPAGTTSGGTYITVTGENFTGATSVTIGGISATSLTVVNDTTLTVITPSSAAGAASILVTNLSGTNSANSLFAFAVPNVLRIKKSSTTTVVPTGLLEGELAANIADQKLWIGDASQNSILISDYPQRLRWDGGSAGLTAATGRTSLGATTVGSNLFTLTNPTAVTFPRFNLDNTVTALNSADFRTAIGAGTSSTTGTVTSVAISVPTGLSVSGTPITSTGTLAVTLTTGYSIPTTAKQTNWDTAYTQTQQWSGGSTNLVAATARTSLGLVIGTNVQAWDADLDAIAALAGTSGLLKKTAANTWSLDTTAYTANTGTVTSVSASVPTGLSISGSPITSSGTLAITLTAGYSIPATSSQGNWDTAYTNRITSLTTTGSSGSATLVTNTLNIPAYTLSGLGGQASSANLTSVAGLTYVSASFVKMTASGTFSLDTTAYTANVGTVTSVAALTLGTTGTDLSSTVATGTVTPVITLNVPTASATNRGALSSTDWSNFNTAYTNRITSLTVTGASGAATLTSNVLNIPTYTLSGLGGIKLADLSSTATGLTYTNTTGVFSLTSGYSIPTTTKQGNWDTAYTQTQQWSGGSTNLVAATGRTSLGATTVGGNLFTLINPSAVTFPRFNLDNTVTALDAATFRGAIGAGTSSTTGTVTSVAISVPTGLSVSGTPITSTGTLAVTLTAGYSIPTTASQGNWDTAYSNRITSLTTTGTGAATLTSNVLNIPTPATATFTSLTVTGSSGASTLSTGVLNVPTYTLAGLGGQALATNLTSLSGLTYVSASFVKMTATGTFALDTTAYGTGSVTSIATTSPITGGTITGTGTIGINASSANTASYVVQRDASGNFAAGIITANLFGIATSATNILGGNPGQIPYITWEGSTGFTPTGIKGQALTSNGTAPPIWSSAPSAASSIFLANNFGGF
jgi:hypothetical protein